MIVGVADFLFRLLLVQMIGGGDGVVVVRFFESTDLILDKGQLREEEFVFLGIMFVTKAISFCTLIFLF